MKADEAYRWLVDAGAPGCDGFDIHVVASILALAIDEACNVRHALGLYTGLSSAGFSILANEIFPAAAGTLVAMSDVEPTIDEEEQSLRDILLFYANGQSPLERPLSAMIARRCKAPHHLWQDLGLRHRTELSQLMARHFTRLSLKNRSDMKWKKFLYRMVCGSEGFTLCTAPVCTECDDFADCFGGEDGEARLARSRNGPAASA